MDALIFLSISVVYGTGYLTEALCFGGYLISWVRFLFGVWGEELPAPKPLLCLALFALLMERFIGAQQLNSSSCFLEGTARL